MTQQHDRSRNITASPLAGLGGRPPLRRLVRALDTAIVADPVLAALPGRFLLAVDDGTGGAALAQSDIGLRRAGREVDMVIAAAHRRAGSVRRGGGGGHDGGESGRGPWRGPRGDRVADLDDRRRGRGRGDRRFTGPASSGGRGQTPARPDRRGQCRNPGSAAEPGTAADPGNAADPGSAAGRAFLVAAAPLSRLDGAQAALIGGLLRPGDVLRLASAGRVVIPLAMTAAAALARLAGSGLLTSDDDPRAGVTACSGLACERAVADVRALARPLPGHPRAHWVGCPRGCGRPPDAELIVAEGPDRFLVGGQAGPLAGGRGRAGRCVMNANQGNGPAGPVTTAGENTRAAAGAHYERDGARIYRESFAIIRAEADLTRSRRTWSPWPCA